MDTIVVKLRRAWFAPSETTQSLKDPRVIRGRRFRKGLNQVPVELKPHLPADAQIVEDIEAEEMPAPAEEAMDIAHYDIGQAAATETARIEAEAEEARQEAIRNKKRKALEKARAKRWANKDKKDKK